MNAHIKHLQEQVDILYANLNAMKNDPGMQISRNDTPHQGYIPQQQERPLSHGPLPPMDPVPRYRPVGEEYHEAVTTYTDILSAAETSFLPWSDQYGV